MIKLYIEQKGLGVWIMTQLFSNEYFGIGLIITIAFLTILFIIVLIMALRDARKNRQSRKKTTKTI